MLNIIIGITSLLIFIILLKLLIKSDKFQRFIKRKFPENALSWSFLILGISIAYIFITPFIPLYFVELEQPINGSEAIILWGFQFWQPYLMIILLILGILGYFKNYTHKNKIFVILSIIILVLNVLLINWPFFRLFNPLWGLPVAIHSTNSLFLTVYPFINTFLLLFGIKPSNLKRIATTPTNNLKKYLSFGFYFGVASYLITFIPIMVLLFISLFLI